MNGRVAGVDAAPGGWAVIVLDDGAVATAEVVPTFAEVVALDASVLAVDIPFALQADGWRVADREAKRLLGARHSTIFMTPPEAVLACIDYPSANARCRELTGGGLSKQMYNLFARMREVRAAGVPVHEVHPELAFVSMAGAPLPSKRTAEGMACRRSLLANLDLPPAASHDLLDAAVCALVARRIAAGTARSLPEGGPGVIWY